MAWYEEFFGEDYMRFHLCGGEREEQRAPAECDAVVSLLGLQPGARVLDLCCGQGRHSVELARRGFRVTGFDLSDYLLGLAKERAEEAGVEVEFVRGDMRVLPWEDEFDAVLNLFTAFGYLESDEEDEKVLCAISRCLKRGGQLMMDLWNRERLPTMFQPKDWFEHEGYIALDEREWDLHRGRLNLHRRLAAPDGSRREIAFALRVYAHSEMLAAFRRTGLDWTRTCGDYDGSDYSVGSRRMLIIARKPEEVVQ